MNKARRARKKARRQNVHFHLTGTRCTACRPLPQDPEAAWVGSGRRGKRDGAGRNGLWAYDEAGLLR